MSHGEEQSVIAENERVRGLWIIKEENLQRKT